MVGALKVKNQNQRLDSVLIGVLSPTIVGARAKRRRG